MAARLAKGCKSEGALHTEALSAVMEATGGRGWTAEDRRMDAVEHIVSVKREGWKAVIRVKDRDCDEFGDGLPIGRSLAQEPFVPATLRTHGGTREIPTDHLRRTPGFWKVLKLLSDNLETVSIKTHALLASIRALVGLPKGRFISGRPRQAHPPDPLQLLLAF